MYHVIWPQFEPEKLTMTSQHRSMLAGLIHEVYESIEKGEIALSECVFAYISELLLHTANKMQWDAVLKDLLTDENGLPLAYSKQYGKRLFRFDEQWKQTPVHAVHNHFWILSQYGASADPYARLIEQMIQPSGWIYNEQISPTQLRTRMRSELLLNMAMGTAVLAQAGSIAAVAPRLEAAVSSMAPTDYLAAEYYRLLSLKALSAEQLFTTDCDGLLQNCKLPDGFCDFNVADKKDDYMGTKKRVQRDKMVSSPLSTLYACQLSPYASAVCKRETAQTAQNHAKQLTEKPDSIAAFKIRDLDIDFGCGVTMGELIAATILINQAPPDGLAGQSAQLLFNQQQSLFAISGQMPRCRMKQYIQPFEQKLAAMEFSALCGTAPSDAIVQSVPEGCPLSLLKDRLAYWDTIETNESIPTKQALLEATYYSELTDQLALKIERLPNTRILRYGTHDLHEYRGKFFPQLVKSLINIAKIPEGATVLDPFCGSGTTNVEASAAGMNSIGIDLNPLSVKIARTKVSLLDMAPAVLLEETEKLAEKVRALSCVPSPASLWDREELDYLVRWFDQTALAEIAALLCLIRAQENSVLTDFWEVCLSNIIRTVSWQKDMDLRIRKEIYEYSAGSAAKLFLGECQRQTQKIAPYLIALKKENAAHCRIIEGNTASLPAAVSASVGKGDALITSPPYATALPYLDTDRLSLLVLGLVKKNDLKSKALDMIGNREISERQRQLLWQYYENRKGELTKPITDVVDAIAAVNHLDGTGFRRKNLPALLGKYFLDMLDAMKTHVQMLADNAPAFYVVGNNSTNADGKRIAIETDKLLWELALKAGYRQETCLSMELLHSRDIFKEHRGTSESILFFRKA